MSCVRYPSLNAVNYTCDNHNVKCKFEFRSNSLYQIRFTISTYVGAVYKVDSKTLHIFSDNFFYTKIKCDLNIIDPDNIENKIKTIINFS